MTIFTIIVPVYKVEKYITHCLQSILNQTFTNFEVICVDDCGGDNSICIVEEFAKKDSRIKILYQPYNKGVSAARNLALDNAKGKYIFNLDSDDWIENNTLEILKNAFEESGSSSIWFDGYNYDEKTQKKSEKTIINAKKGFIKLSPENIASFHDMCGMKAYTTQSIRDIGLYWPEDIIFDEDGEFYFKYYSYYKTVYSIPNPLYYVRKHDESSVANFTAGKISCKNLFQVLNNLQNFYKKHGIYEDYKITMLKLIQNRINVCKHTFFSEENKKLILEMLKELDFPNDFQKFNTEKFPLVSIVVPIYNVEQYIEQCLYSIINQTYKNIEILCIDDCGQDNSINIAKKLAKKDSRIKIIKHRKNKGLGGARNTGLKKAIGEYILFIDSDDWITEDCIESVVNVMNRAGVDSAWFKADYWLDKEQKKVPMNFCSYFMNLDEGFYWLDNSNISNFPLVTWNKVYRTNFLKKHKLFWRENIIYEDVEFYWKMFTLSQQIFIIDKHFYFYRQRENSIMQTNTNILAKAETAFFVVSEVGKYLKEKNIYEKYEYAYLKYVKDVLNMFGNNQFDSSELKKIKYDFLCKI